MGATGWDRESPRSPRTIIQSTAGMAGPVKAIQGSKESIFSNSWELVLPEEPNPAS